MVFSAKFINTAKFAKQAIESSFKQSSVTNLNGFQKIKYMIYKYLPTHISGINLTPAMEKNRKQASRMFGEYIKEQKLLGKVKTIDVGLYKRLPKANSTYRPTLNISICSN